MMSRHEKANPLMVNSASVRPISQTSALSSTIRKRSASASPICRARFACCGGIRDTITDRKMTLSIPSTISSAVKVRSAAQDSGLVNSAIMPGGPMLTFASPARPQQSDRGVAGDHIEGDHTQGDLGRWTDVEITEQRVGQQNGPQRDQAEREPAQTLDAHRVNDIEG